MRDRLIELLEDGHKQYLYYDQIADYLLENGVIVLPCRVGTRTYRLVPDLSVTWPDPTEYKIIWDTFKLNDLYALGKTVFLTKEQAEKALAEVANET